MSKPTKRVAIYGVVLSAVAVLMWMWADVYLFEDGSIFTTLPTEGDAVQRIEAVGEDLRIYEFTPETAPHKQCVFAAGGNKGGLFCFDKVPTVTSRIRVK